MQWDFDNRLCKAVTSGGTCQYQYDALGRRVTKKYSKTTRSCVGGGRTTVGTTVGALTTSSTTNVYVNLTQPISLSPYAGQEVAEYTLSGSTATLVRKHVYGSYIDEPVMMLVSQRHGRNAILLSPEQSLLCGCVD